MFKCRVCGLKKEDDYCCESDVGICLDCCNDNCEDSKKEWRGEMGMLRVEKIGRFTIARIGDIVGKKRLTGIGIARLSDDDHYNKAIAEKIAIGRAEKALKMKKEGKKIHNLLMG